MEQDLSALLDIQPGEVVSLVGAGGKTTAMLRLADELGSAGHTVLITTTTRILEPITRSDETLLLSNSLETLIVQLHSLPDTHRKVFLAHHRLAEADPRFAAQAPYPAQANKVAGLPPTWIDHLHRAFPEAIILVEADGARHRYLKAPAAHEPVVPSTTTLLIPLADLAILGCPLNDRYVHRPERVSALLGIPLNTPITPQHLAHLLTHPQGGLKNAPLTSRVIPLLTWHTGRPLTPAAVETARRLAEHPRVSRVVLAALRASSPVLLTLPHPTVQVAAVVLAAGASQRMGQPKQLLPWGEKTMLQQVVDTLLVTPVSEIIVVLGYRAEDIAPTLQDRPVHIVVNQDWPQGLSTSVRTGLQALHKPWDAVLFALADQPNIPSEVITALIEEYQRKRALLVVPTYQGQRGNPVIFDRSLLPELLAIQGDQGGRQLLARHREKTAEVVVDTPAVITDIDTPDDYDDYLVAGKLQIDR